MGHYIFSSTIKDRS